MPEFSLAEQPWVPVRISGRSSLVGLRQLFHDSHTIDDLAISSPPAAASLLRILYAIAARVTGLDVEGDGSDDWDDRRVDLLDPPSGAVARFDSDRIDEYFARYADRWDLFGERPFIQDPRLASDCPKSSGINKLMWGRPSGQNHLWFGHFSDVDPVPVPSGEAALHLIAQVYYGPSGRCTSREVRGTREANSMGGPLRSCLSYHPAGRTLFETLVCGLVDPAQWPGVEGPDSLCPWELEELPDPLAPPANPVGFCAALTRRGQHAVLLVPDADGDAVTDAYVTWSARHKAPPTTDPYIITDFTKDAKPYPRPASADRALWRDLDALLSEAGGNSRGARPSRRPLAMDGLAASVPEETAEALRVVAFGFDQDGQTRDRQWFAAATPPILGFVKADRLDAQQVIAAAREAAELAGDRLMYALRTAWQLYIEPNSQAAKPSGDRKGLVEEWPRQAAARYWPVAEDEFWRIIDRLRAGEPVTAFTGLQPVFGRLALDAFDRTTEKVAHQPRGARARFNARGLVASLVRSSKPDAAQGDAA